MSQGIEGRNWGKGTCTTCEVVYCYLKVDISIKNVFCKQPPKQIKRVIIDRLRGEIKWNNIKFSIKTR